MTTSERPTSAHRRQPPHYRQWKKPTPADIRAAAKVLGDTMPRHITQGSINGPDICTHCGPFPRSMSFVNHLAVEHAITYADYRNTVSTDL